MRRFMKRVQELSVKTQQAKTLYFYSAESTLVLSVTGLCNLVDQTETKRIQMIKLLNYDCT